MKASFFALFSFLSLFIGAFAAPAQVEKRADPTALITALYGQVQAQTAIINSTTAGLNSASTAADNATATTTIYAALSAINSAVVSTTSEVNALGASKRAIFARQDETTALATLVEDLVLDISGALNNIISTLGLSKFSFNTRTILDVWLMNLQQLPSSPVLAPWSAPSPAFCSRSRPSSTTSLPSCRSSLMAS